MKKEYDFSKLKRHKKPHTKRVHAKFQHGEEEIRKKKGISHEDAKRRLRKWAG